MNSEGVSESVVNDRVVVPNGGRRRKRGWVFVVELVLCVAFSPNNLHQFKQRGSHKGILRS